MPTSKIISKNNLENVESSSDFLRSLISFTGSMLSSASSLLQKHWFNSIFFPLTFVLDLITHLFIAINFIKLANKNLGNTSKLILSMISTIFTFIAVIFFFVSSYPFAVGLCLLVSMGVGTILNIGLFTYNSYQLLQLLVNEKNKDLKAIYKSNCFKYGIATLVGMITLSSFILSVFLFPYLATGILMATGILSGIVVLATGFYKLVNYFMISQQESFTFHPVIKSVPLVPEYERLIDNLSSPAMNEQADNAPSFQYYKNENRRQYLSEDIAKNRAYLLMEIFKKINILESEIKKNKGKLGERIWMQEEKRLEKEDLLVDLAIFLLPICETQAENILDRLNNKILISENIHRKIMLQFQSINKNQTSQKTWNNNEDFYQFFNDYHSDKAFQSFFKNVSDIKDLFDAVKHHFDIEKFLELEKLQKKIHVEKEQMQITLQETDPEIIKKLENFQFPAYVYSEKIAEDFS